MIFYTFSLIRGHRMGATQNDKDDLAERKCTPCGGDVEPLKGDAPEKLLAILNNGWQIIEEHHLEKHYKFKDFAQALEFVNRVGQTAEELGHHPDIYLGGGKVRLAVWTHKIKGLHENDFIFAAKTDKLYMPA
jgi:4a-hydroxytetrahydrobiopterin dehydratase